MNLKVRIPASLQQKSELTLAERAELSCDLAKQFERVGDYESAREALDEFWPRTDQPYVLEELAEQEMAELLLRIGAVAGWWGGASQSEGSQETAKNFITKSIEIFDRIGRSKESAEAPGDLAL